LHNFIPLQKDLLYEFIREFYNFPSIYIDFTEKFHGSLILSHSFIHNSDICNFIRIRNPYHAYRSQTKFEHTKCEYDTDLKAQKNTISYLKNFMINLMILIYNF
jgi:hypothetical protein